MKFYFQLNLDIYQYVPVGYDSINPSLGLLLFLILFIGGDSLWKQISEPRLWAYYMGCHPRSRSVPRKSITDSCPSSVIIFFSTNHDNYLTSDTCQTYGQLLPQILAPANYCFQSLHDMLCLIGSLWSTKCHLHIHYLKVVPYWIILQCFVCILWISGV